MIQTENFYALNMTDQQRAWFNAEYTHRKKDEVVGILLAFFLGIFGIHQFYLDRRGAGILYLCLSITGISAILGFIDCFFMPGRVREYNANLASLLSAEIQNLVPGQGTGSLTSQAARPCLACSQPMPAGAVFCSRCGAPASAAVA